MNVPWKIMTSRFDAQYCCSTRAWHKKIKLSIARSPWDLTWNVCLCARFIKGNVNLLLGHISAQQLYLEDRSVCLFSSSNNAWGCQVGASEGLCTEKIEIFNIQVKICKIRSNVTPRTHSLPRFSKDLQFYFHSHYDGKGQTENTIWNVWPLCWYTVTKVISASGPVLTESF